MAESARMAPIVKSCRSDEAEAVHAITQTAFGAYFGFLDPPSGVIGESLDSVRRDLETHGGAIAWIGTQPVGCLRFAVQTDHLVVRRWQCSPRINGSVSARR